MLVKWILFVATWLIALGIMGGLAYGLWCILKETVKTTIKRNKGGK